MSAYTDKDFWARISVEGTCWNWTGAIGKGGYGRFRIRGCEFLVHRYALGLRKQKSLKEEVVDHICRNRKCLRPEHLRLVSRRDNSIENSSSVAAVNLVKTHCNNGHEFSVANTYHFLKPNGYWQRCCRACNRRIKRTTALKGKRNEF